MHENFELPLTCQKKKIELGTVSWIDQYGYAYHGAKFGACIKNRTIQKLCRRTIIPLTYMERPDTLGGEPTSLSSIYNEQATPKREDN